MDWADDDDGHDVIHGLQQQQHAGLQHRQLGLEWRHDADNNSRVLLVRDAR